MDTEQPTVAEFSELPGIYGVQLQDHPQSGSVTVTPTGGGTALTEVTSGEPASGEFRVDYTYRTGKIIFNSAQDSIQYDIDYSGGGSINTKSSSLWQATGDDIYNTNADRVFIGDSSQAISDTGFNLHVNTSTSWAGQVIKCDQTSDTGGASLYLMRTRSDGVCNDNDYLGRVAGVSFDSVTGPNTTVYADIKFKAIDVSDTTEDGQIELSTMQGGSLTTVMTIDESGYVGIGIAPTRILTVNSISQFRSWINIMNPASAGNHEYGIGPFYNNDDLHFFHTTNGFAAHTKYMEIHNDGRVGMPAVNSTHKLAVTGTAGLSTGTLWTNTSDRRLKENITTLTGALTKLNALNPVSFTFIEDYRTKADAENKTYYSFLADEYQTHFADDVKTVDLNYTGGETPDYEQYLEVNYSALIPYLVAAVQELDTKKADV
jgi:hypothetical protein